MELIHYNVLVLAGIVGGLFASLKNGSPEFHTPLIYGMLIYPILSLPLTFTQWNDELIVYKIGDYVERIKTELLILRRYQLNHNIWGWESFHKKNKTLPLRFTAVARSGIFILFAFLALCTACFNVNACDWGNIIILGLFFVDLGLILAGVAVGVKMLKDSNFIALNHTKKSALKSPLIVLGLNNFPNL